MVLGHLIRLVMSVQFLGPHLYRSAIFPSVQFLGPHLYDRSLSCQFESGPHLYDRSLSCQFESGPHLYDRPSYCHVSSVSRTAPIRSVIILSVWVGAAPIQSVISLSVQFEFGPHLYWSVIHRVSRVGAAPILIGHLPISSVRVWTAPISIGHCLVSLNRGRTHIDRPFSYQFVFSLSRDCTHIDRSFLLPVRSVRRPVLYFSMTFRVTAPSIHIHWHCTYHLHGFALILVLLTLLPYAYRFIIALLGFPFHYTWHSSLSPWRIFRSCCWAPYTWHSRIVHIGQSPSGTFFLVLQGGSTVTHLWHRSLGHFWKRLRGSLDP